MSRRKTRDLLGSRREIKGFRLRTPVEQFYDTEIYDYRTEGSEGHCGPTRYCGWSQMCTLNTMTNRRSEECLKITETTNKIIKAGSSLKKRKMIGREERRERERDVF